MAYPTRRKSCALGIASAAVPLGLTAPRVLATSRPSSSLDGAPPICHVSAEVPLTVVSGPRRNLKLTWNASAISPSVCRLRRPRDTSKSATSLSN